MKFKEIQKLSKNDRGKKLNDLKMELIKSYSKGSKTTSKTKDIKKIIAKILTFNNSQGGVEQNK